MRRCIRVLGRVRRGDSLIKGREGYFNLDPILLVRSRVFKRDLRVEYVTLPLDGVSTLTFVSERMGPVPGWKNHFREANDREYNPLTFDQNSTSRRTEVSQRSGN